MMTNRRENPFDIVFTDVDGTFCDDGHQPIAQGVPAIARLSELGIPLCLVSARMPEGLTPIQEALAFSGPLVCYSGAYVLDETGSVLESHPIGIDVAAEVKEFLATELPEVCCNVYGYHDWVVDDDQDPRVRNEEGLVHVKAEVAHDLGARFGERGVHKFLLMGEPAQIDAARARVSAEYPELNVVPSSPILLEIMSGEASKGEGVRAVCARFGIDPSRSAAFGDGLNDLDMFAAVGHAFAMANAVPEVKAAAAETIPWTNDQNGVARTILERLV